MEITQATERRSKKSWLRFSLRSLLVATSVVAIVLASVAYWQTPRLERDVKVRIRRDFPVEQYNEVRRVLLSYDPDAPRIHRCILHLAEGDFDKLKQAAYDATMDYRDVIMWAEYEQNGGGWHDDRVRNYNRPFDEAAQRGCLY